MKIFTAVTFTVSHRIRYKFFCITLRLAPCCQLRPQIFPRVEESFQQNAKTTSPNALDDFKSVITVEIL